MKITVLRAKGSKATVRGEGREVELQATSMGGTGNRAAPTPGVTFTDTFDGYAVHLYEIAP